MEFLARITKDHGLDFGERNRVIFKRYLAENPGMVLKITPVLPESKKQRGFLEGAVIPLVAFYQEGMDHRDHAHLRDVREWLKAEFNGDMVVVAGKALLVPKSTKGREALNAFLEKVLVWLQENYEPPAEALDPGRFKEWRDTIFPYGGPSYYIDYLIEIGTFPQQRGGIQQHNGGNATYNA